MVACLLLLSGCAVYHAQPLPTRPDLTRTPALRVPTGELALPAARPQSFDLRRGLTEDNIVTLAVMNNPRLKAVRQQAGVAQAQLLAAGLLPDPQLSGGPSRSALFTGYSASVTEEIQALVTRGAARAAARAHADQVNLDILWQEWQVAAQARRLDIEVRMLDPLQQVLDRRRTMLRTLYARDQRSLQQGFVTLSGVSADFAAWDAAETAWRDVELQDNQTHHALNELLGLVPDAQLRLAASPQRPPFTVAQFRAALDALPRRPDLLALQAGYRSEQEQLREAILAQFPLLSAGVEKARDPVESVQSIGFTVTLTLPLFNRNRGAIAIARASRAALYQAYQASLDESTNQADQVWHAVRIMQQQLATLERRRVQLDAGASSARDSLRHGRATLADYTVVGSNALMAEAEEIQLRASLQQAEAALALLLGMPS